VSVRLSKALLVAGDLAEAKVFAQYTVQLDPAAPDGHSQLGLVDLLTGNYAEAIQELEDAVRLSTQLTGKWESLNFTRYNLARAYSCAGQPARALETLQQVVPHNADYTRFARQDPKLAGLRNDPVCGPKFATLLRQPSRDN
jgi:tetratricopeptide (TPR) repeat protein